MTAHTPLALTAVALAAFASAADVKPTAGTALPGRTPTAAIQPHKTGLDLKAVDIGTTGPPHYYAILTFQNVGTKATPAVRYLWKYQNQIIDWGDVPALAAGQRYVKTREDATGGFARFGATLSLFVDCDNVVKEDDENNNHLTKTLPRPPFKPPSVPRT